jgi:HK97 gp10 family phage protein
VPGRDAFEFRFNGLDSLDRALNELGAELKSEILATALRRAARPFLRRARQLAPRGTKPKKESKRLANSIRTSSLPKGRRERFEMAGAAGIRAGARAPHAHLVEYGHAIVPRGPSIDHATEARMKKLRSQARAAGPNADEFLESLRQRALKYKVPRRRRGGAAIGHVRPHPFMRPAWDSSRAAVVRSIKDEIAGVLRRKIRAIASKVRRGKLSPAQARELLDVSVEGARKLLGD